MIINQLRDYRVFFTESTLHINGGERFCWVLEDIGRPHGVKVPKETCIPEGHYKCIISVSTRWQKPMLLLYNTVERSVERFGVTFTGIRPHGGNRTSDTSGCPLLGYNSDHEGLVFNRASDDLLIEIKKAIDNGETIDWIISEKGNM